MIIFDLDGTLKELGMTMLRLPSDAELDQIREALAGRWKLEASPTWMKLAEFVIAQNLLCARQEEMLQKVPTTLLAKLEKERA